MLNLGTKSLLGLGATALLAALAYGVGTNEGSGTTLLAFIAAGAAALGAVAVSVGPDRAPAPTAVAGTQNSPAGDRPMLPSIWPLAGGMAGAILAIGAATNGIVVVAGIVVALAAVLGWVFQVWSEHPRFTARFGARLSDRLLVPLALPLAVFALVLVIAVSLSRVLLALPEQGSRAVALAVAVLILSGAFFVASQERIARAALSLLCVAALIAVVAAGVAGLVHGERKFDKSKGAASAPPVVASIATQGDNLAFSTDVLDLPAGRPVGLLFDNQSHGIPHNIGIYDKPGLHELSAGATVIGPKKVTYTVNPLGAGTYYFQCDVHPTMHGTVHVTAGGHGTTGPAAASPATSSASPSTTAAVSAGLATTPPIAGP